MAQITVVQALTSASVANAPTTASITSVATTANNLLLWIVTATSSGTPTIASPGGAWAALYNTSIAGLAYALYVQLANAGGITTITSNLATTTAGGACAGFLELASTPGSQAWANDFNTSYNQGTTSVPWSNTITNVVKIGEFIFYCIHRQASTLTNKNTFEWNNNFGTTVSTGSTTNAQQDGFACLTGESLGQPAGGGTLSGAVPSALGYARFTSPISFPFNYPTAPEGGNSGIYVPIFNQGMIGG